MDRARFRDWVSSIDELTARSAAVRTAPQGAVAGLCRTLPKLDADSVKRALASVIAPDALLVSDAGRCHRPAAAALGILARASTAPPASGCAGPCTSRRPPVATSRSRVSCAASAASPPNAWTAVRGGSISSSSAGIHRQEPVSKPPAPDHACDSRIELILERLPWLPQNNLLRYGFGCRAQVPPAFCPQHRVLGNL